MFHFKRKKEPTTRQAAFLRGPSIKLEGFFLSIFYFYFIFLKISNLDIDLISKISEEGQVNISKFKFLKSMILFF